MDKFFRIPFAQSGDKAAIPDPVDVDGNVSYTQGFGFDYERQKTDPAHKNIPRDLTNGLYFAITTALAELQSQGVPDFITSALNGGSAFSYTQFALVKYAGDLYISLAAANTALPSDATKWALLPTPSRVRDGYNTVAVSAGTPDAITIALTPTQTVLAPGPTWWRATAANATTTPTIKRDGLAAKTLVKGNNLPLVAGDIPGAGAWVVSQYDATLDKEVLLNPAYGVIPPPAIQGAFKNLKLSASGLSANVVATVDEIVVESASNACQVLRSVNLTIAGTSVGANGLDAGVMAINTLYSVWVIWNGTTTAGLLSLSATAPTFPSGYTHKARIGWIRTDGTANKFPLVFTQSGRCFRYAPAAGTNLPALGLLASGPFGSTTTPTWSAIGLAPHIPTTARQAVFLGHVGNGTIMCAPSNNYGAYNSTTNAPPFAFAAAAATISATFSFALETMNVYYACDVAAGFLSIVGWDDNI